MPHPKKMVSPSRTYVAMCNKMNFDGFYFLRFILPEKDPWNEHPEYQNNAEVASWHFLNRLNPVACVQDVMMYEDYQNLTDQPD